MTCENCEKYQKEIYATLVGPQRLSKNLCDECTLREVDVEIIYEITDRVIKFNYFDKESNQWCTPWLIKEPLNNIILIIEETAWQ